MSYRDKDGNVVIEEEPAGVCELCGEKRELRPYGPNGENICVPCGMKDPKTTYTNMGKKLFGESQEHSEQLANLMQLLLHGDVN